MVVIPPHPLSAPDKPPLSPPQENHHNRHSDQSITLDVYNDAPSFCLDVRREANYADIDYDLSQEPKSVDTHGRTCIDSVAHKRKRFSVQTPGGKRRIRNQCVLGHATLIDDVGSSRALTKVNGDLVSLIASASAGAEGPIPPKTAEQKLAMKNELKAKSTLMLSIPDEHLLKFHACKDTKSLWEAIKNRFGGNKESKKIQKTILKQNYEQTLLASSQKDRIKTMIDNSSSTNEIINTAHSVYAASSKDQASTASYVDDVIFSFFSNQSNTPQLDNEDLEQIDADDLRNGSQMANGNAYHKIISQEDANLKLLRSLPSSWNNIALIMRNKSDLDTLSMDDLYNNLKVYESKIKVQSSSSSNSQNVAFVSSENTSSTNEAVNTAHEGNRNGDGPRRNALVDTSTTNAPIIEDWDTDSDNDSVFRRKTDQTKPKFTKISFVKSDENVKSINKENTHKQVEYPRKSQSPRANRRNWNGMMTQKLGNGFEFIKKACFVCEINHLIKDYDFYDNKMVEKPVLNNKGRVTGQREIRLVWNNAQRVNHQNKFTHPHPKRNFVPTAVATKSGKVPVNAAKQNSPRAATSISTARPVNIVAPKSKVNDALPKTYSYFKAHSSVFFLATKDETSGILKTFIIGIENQINHKVKIIRCDNGNEFKNNDMNQFCGMKGIKREFSVARIPQQNRVVKRKNRTLIEAARTMLADSFLPTTFWAEVVNTACYVQNKVLVTKPHNKTPYELLHGRPPSIRFMRPFGCHVTILNTLDPLGKFDRKADEGAPRAWYETLSTYLLKNRFRRGTIDKTLFIKKDKDAPEPPPPQPDPTPPAQEIPDKFYGELTFLLRVAGKRRKKWNLHQPRQDEEAEDVDVHLYRSMIGSLMYLTTSRPVIMFDVCACASAYAEQSLTRNPQHEVCQFLVKSDSWQDGISDEFGVKTSSCKVNAARQDLILLGKIDFLTASTIHYALTVSPTIYASYIKQFLNTAHSQIVNDVKQIHATVDDKTVVISESSVRSDLHFNDEDGITCLTNDAIFENLALMGLKSTSWNEFSTNLASTVICLANAQKFNFSKLIFDEPFNNVYKTPAHTKKVFTNMKRKGKDFSGRVTLLFASMLAPSVVEGEGSGHPSEPQPPPSTAQPTNEEQIPNVLPQTSVLIPNVADEAVFKEWDDNVERAATTDASLDAEQDSGNILKTQSTAIPNVPLYQEISTGGSPRCQEAMGGIIAQTRSERVPTPSYDSPFLGGNTPVSDEERIEQHELTDNVPPTPPWGLTSPKVLDLEKEKDAQAVEILKLKKIVKQLKRKAKSSIPPPKRRLYNHVDSSDDILDEENVSKQGRYNDKTKPMFDDSDFAELDDINNMVDDAMDNVEGDAETQGRNSTGDAVTTAGVSISAVEPRTPPITTTTVFEDEDLTIAQTLVKMRSEKAKEKGVAFRDVEESARPTRVRNLPTIDPKDKGKGIMQEPEKPPKNPIKAQIQRDAEIAQKLFEEEQAQFKIEQRIARERAAKQEAKDVALMEQMEDIQARIDADALLAKRL
ncbi:putative ribonuclease H-like domain-containing protein [Tanacetum coccineum]